MDAHVAEKLHALTLPRSHPNSRVKDLPDLALLGTIRHIAGSDLRSAIEQTFTSRGTHDVPQRLPDPPNAWAPVYERMARENGLPWLSLPSLLEAVRGFLDPVLDGDPGTWEPSGLDLGVSAVEGPSTSLPMNGEQVRRSVGFGELSPLSSQNPPRPSVDAGGRLAWGGRLAEVAGASAVRGHGEARCALSARRGTSRPPTPTPGFGSVPDAHSLQTLCSGVESGEIGLRPAAFRGERPVATRLVRRSAAAFRDLPARLRRAGPRRLRRLLDS